MFVVCLRHEGETLFTALEGLCEFIHYFPPLF